MRLSLAAAVFLASISGAAASAQSKCGSGRSDLLSVQEYDASVTQVAYSNGLELNVQISNESGRDIRMIDGSILFQDVLGRDIIRIAIEPDQKIAADGSVKQEGLYTNTRLADVAPEDVVVSTCVRGLVYADGEVFKAGE